MLVVSTDQRAPEVSADRVLAFSIETFLRVTKRQCSVQYSKRISFAASLAGFNDSDCNVYQTIVVLLPFTALPCGF